MKYVRILQVRCGSTYQKSSSIKFSIEQAAAIRTPSPFRMVARSMPLSSARNIFRKSPTLCDTGLNANWHFSLRLGSGTTTCGRPRMYFTVTSMEREEKKSLGLFIIYFDFLCAWFYILFRRNSKEYTVQRKDAEYVDKLAHGMYNVYIGTAVDIMYTSRGNVFI